MTSFLNLPNVIENKLTRMGATTFNINAEVTEFKRNMVPEKWTPERRTYVYTAEISLHIPYYSSQEGRPDTYDYDILYKKLENGKLQNIGGEWMECKKKNELRRAEGKTVLLDSVKQNLKNDNERRKTLPAYYGLYLREVFTRKMYETPNRMFERLKKNVLKRINEKREEHDLRIKDVSKEATPFFTKYKATAYDIVFSLRTNDKVVKQGEDGEVMQDFRRLVAETMKVMCSDIFAHGIKPVPEESIVKRMLVPKGQTASHVKNMFVIPKDVVDGNFWRNLVKQIKLKERRRDPYVTPPSYVLPEELWDHPDWEDMYDEEYQIEVSGTRKKRPKVCPYDDKKGLPYEHSYIVDNKFPLIANTTYLLSKTSGIRILNELPELKF